MVAFLMLIAAEMIGAKSGLGWVVRNSTINYVIPRVFLAAVVLAILGALLEWAIDGLERRVVRWKPARAI
jgi:NitT/TauT family transport system permease protein